MANYSITINNTTGGSVGAVYGDGSITSVPAGANVSVSVSPLQGRYEFGSFNQTPSNLAINYFNTYAGTTYYTFTMPSSNVVLNPSWHEIWYSITAKTNPDGAGTVVAPAAAQYNDLIEISQTPAPNYVFSHWILYNPSVGNQQLSRDRFIMPENSVRITAHYTTNPHDLTWSDASLTLVSDGRTVTATMTGQAIDSFGESVTYYLRKGDTNVAVFTDGVATFQLLNSDSGVERTYYLVAQTTIESIGATETLTATFPVDDDYGNYDGLTYLPAILYIYDGSTSINLNGA